MVIMVVSIAYCLNSLSLLPIFLFLFPFPLPSLHPLSSSPTLPLSPSPPLLSPSLSDSRLLDGGKYSRKLVVQRARAGDELKIHYISLTRVGVDVHEVFTPKYTTSNTTGSVDHKPKVSRDFMKTIVLLLACS